MTFTQKALWQCGMPLYQFNVALIRIYLSTSFIAGNGRGRGGWGILAMPR